MKTAIFFAACTTCVLTISANANNLVCPALTFSDVKRLTSERDTFQVANNPGHFQVVEGYDNLPNRISNPITLAMKWRPTVKSTEHDDSAVLKCNYEYKTALGKEYTFSIQNMPQDPQKYLQAVHTIDPSIARMDVTFTDIKKAYRNASRTAHPDKGGSEERQKELNGAYDAVKPVFGMK